MYTVGLMSSDLLFTPTVRISMEAETTRQALIMAAVVPIFSFFMVALCNRGPLYFCPVVSFYLLYLSSIYLSFFPRLILAVTDWMSTILLHMAWP